MLPLSVIIPTYNRASQLDATLASLTRQTRSDFQVVVVNHGSSDHTEEIALSYQAALHLTYAKIERDGVRFASVPRDFGVQQAEAALILFLDTGMVVPSWFIESHIAFQHSHPNHVGIGLQHGYQGMESFQENEAGENRAEEQVTSLLDRIDIDHAYAGIQQGKLQDQRDGIDLEHSSIPWFFGWTANLSLTKAAYEAVGGFDLELEGWGFEDVDLCYRLFKDGQCLAFVEDGWGIELPQERAPMFNRLQSHQLNQLRCYGKQRSVALEGLLLAQIQLRQAITAYYEEPVSADGQEKMPLSSILDLLRTEIAVYSDETVRYLMKIKSGESTPIQETVHARIERPSLLVGGRIQDVEYYDYVAIGDEQITSTPAIWSCWGIRNPLPDQALATVVISDIWTQLNWSLQFSFGVKGILLLETLIAEIKRVARKAIFVYSSSDLIEQDGLVSLLEELCQKHELDFELLAPVYARV